MKLLDRTGYKDDAFVRVEAGGVAGVARPIVPLADLASALEASNEALGVDVPNTATAEALQPHFARLALIAVAFPSFGDGRGFSLARRLRRAGFSGVLRATGPLIADQLADAIACGFDEIELPDASAGRQPGEQWARAGAAISASYQRGYTFGANILDQRRAARKER